MHRISAYLVAIPPLLVATGVLVFAACTTSWAPDSKSFFYTRGGREVMLRDISQKRSKTIVTFEPPSTGSIFQVGVRDDGKQLAVVRLYGSKKKPFAKFHVFDMAGQPIHTSEKIDLTGKTKASQENIHFEFCYWGGHKYLIGAAPHLECMFSYDIEKKEHRVYEKTIPVSMVMNQMAPWSSISPASTDGSSFVVVKGNGLKLIPLPNGDPQEIKVLDGPNRFSDDGPKPSTGSVRLPGYWKGQTLIYPRNGGHLRLDTKTKSVSYVATEKMKRLFAHAVSGKSVVIGHLSEDWIVEATRNQKADLKDAMKLRIYNISTKEEKSLPKVDHVLGVSVTPAPDRKHSIIFVFSNAPTYFVVDAKGDVVDRVENVLGPFIPSPQ